MLRNIYNYGLATHVDSSVTANVCGIMLFGLSILAETEREYVRIRISVFNMMKC